MNYRKLDELVAEKFFGLCLHKNTERTGEYHQNIHCLECNEECSVSGAIMSGWGYSDAYSSDMNLVWQVLNKLRDSGNYCCLELSSDYNYIYDFNLTKSELLGNLGHKITIHVTNGHPAVAICLAALATVGLDKEEVYKLIGE